MYGAIGILILLTPCLLFPPLGLAVVGFVALWRVLAWIDRGSTSGGSYHGE